MVKAIRVWIDEYVPDSAKQEPAKPLPTPDLPF